MSSIVIASRVPPGSVGGLAEYQRGLAAHWDGGGVFVSAPRPGDEFSESGEVLAWPHFSLKHPSAETVWPRMASRPRFHPVLQRWIEQSFQMPVVPDCRAVHYVGTGWDFFGFAVRRFARRIKARFTVWPAVHPGQWGDDTIDLRLYRAADAVFCQSQGEADHLVARGLSRERVVSCGLPPMCSGEGDGARWRMSQGLQHRPLVFFLGRRDAGKGFPALLAAWPEVVRVNPDAVLLVAGPGEQLPRSESMIDLGILNSAEKENVYSACDVFCLPTAHESFGIVFVEAWSYAKPVICGPAAAPREWIHDGVNGLHADQDPASVGLAINRLLGSESLRTRLGEAGRKVQRERFSWEAVLAAHQNAWAMG